MIAHCPAGVELDAVGGGDRARLGERRLEARRQAASARSAPTRAPVATVAAASTASRAAFSQSTARSLVADDDLDPGNARAARARARAPRRRARRDAARDRPRPAASAGRRRPARATTRTPGRSSRPRRRAARGAVELAPRPRRIASTCSRPLRSGRTTAPSSASGAIRSRAASRSYALTATTRSDTGLEPLDGLGVRHGRLAAVHERQARARGSPSTVRSVPTQSAPVRAASIPPIAAERRGRRSARRHVSAGSTTRFTYCVSE